MFLTWLNAAQEKLDEHLRSRTSHPEVAEEGGYRRASNMFRLFINAYVFTASGNGDILSMPHY